MSGGVVPVGEGSGLKQKGFGASSERVRGDYRVCPGRGAGGRGQRSWRSPSESGGARGKDWLDRTTDKGSRRSFEQSCA